MPPACRQAELAGLSVRQAEIPPKAEGFIPLITKQQVMATGRTVLILLSWLLFTLPLFGQIPKKHCSRCYILSNSGDTLRCSVEIQDDYSHLKKIRVKLKGEEEYRKVKVSEIQALCVPGRYYEKVEIDNGYYLLERVLNGYVKMYLDYSFEWEGTEGYDPDDEIEIEAEDPDPTKIPLYYIMMGDKIYRLDREKYREELAEYFKDYKDLSDRLLKEDIQYNDVACVVKEYNQWKAEEIK